LALPELRVWHFGLSLKFARYGCSSCYSCSGSYEDKDKQKKKKKKSVFNNIAENFPVNIKLRISERKSKLPYRRPKVS
jgi:hypothetical protein